MTDAQPMDPVTDLAPIEKHPSIGAMPNKAHQGAGGFKSAKTYQLAIVEFDDQGRCYCRQQMDDVADRVDAMRTGREDAILLVFVHGWKHNAETNDPNLMSFCDVLARTAKHETDSATGAPRPVMGVYVGWRGKSTYGMGDAVADTTFWGRQEAGHRVATGSVRELFGRLRHYRNSRLKDHGSALLVIAGHSFGGMIVFSALAQSLIQSASTPVGKVIPGFADLVLLVNPAIEGARYFPINDLVTSKRFADRTSAQLPIFVCVQAKNDQPIGTWFPVGNFKNRLNEAAIGELETRCITHAIGFIDEFRTHELAWTAASGPFVLNPPEIKESNPFWVVSADKDVVDGHGGIWQAPFLSFLKAIIFQHVNLSRDNEADAGPSTAPPKRPESGPISLARAVMAKANAASDQGNGRLADFARKIDQPIVGNGASTSVLK